MFANNWIYWKVELLQLVKMKRNNKFKKIFIWLFTGKSLYYISTQPFSTTYKHYFKIISREMENLWHIHYFWNAMSIIS